MRNLFTKMGGVESAARKMGKNILSLLLLTSLATTSCKDDSTELRSALGEQLTLSVGVNSSTASRAMVIGTQLPEGSSIGVRVTDGGADYQGTDYSHVRFTSAGTGEAQKWTAEPPVYLSGQAATIYAYSPYQSTEGFEMTAIPVDMTEADQTDWLYATPVTGPCDSSPKADITLNHALTAFTLSFHKEGYPGAGEVTAVKIQSPALATGGTLDAAAGEFTEVTGQGDALTRTAAFTLGDAVTSASTVQVMMVPTALKAALNITVTVDGKDYTAATASMNFIAGHNYALTMKLTAKDLGLSEVEIIDWQNVDLGEDQLQPEENYITARFYIEDNQINKDVEIFSRDLNLDYWDFTKDIQSMWVDGIEIPVNPSYKFTSGGLHEVKYKIMDGQGYYYPSKLFYNSYYENLWINEGMGNTGNLNDKDLAPVSIEIPSSYRVESIDLFGSYKLTEIELTAHLKSIKDFSIGLCYGLKEFVVPENVTALSRHSLLRSRLNYLKVLPTTAPTIDKGTANNGACVFLYESVRGGLLIVPKGCTDAYSQWMSAEYPYFGYYGWKCIEEGDYILENGIFYSSDKKIVLGNDGSLSGTVVIPEGVIEITDFALHNNNMTDVVLPGTLEKMGSDVFDKCNDLNTIKVLSSEACEINSNTFRGIAKAGLLIIPSGTGETYNDWLVSDNYYLGYSNWHCVIDNNYILENGIYYSKDGKTVLGNDGTLAGAVTIKEGVTSINAQAFYNCKAITEITLPGTLQTIGEAAFSYCDQLGTITSLATTAPTINSNTFYGVKKGGTLIVPEGCTDAYSQWMSTNYAYLGYYNWLCLEEGSYTLENGIYYSTDGKTVLGNDGTVSGAVTIKEGVTSIDGSAFSNCTGITSVTLPSTLTSIGEDAFYGCYNLATITSLATTAPTIDNYTFRSVKNGGTLIVPEGCTDAYSLWMSTDSYYLGYYEWLCLEEGSVIENGIYYSADGTKVLGNDGTVSGTVTIKEEVTEIGDRAFKGCTGITSLTFPSTLTIIGQGAFSRCTGITSLTFPSTLTSIGEDAFYGCSNLAVITSLATTAPTISSSTFNGVKSAGKLYIPAGATGYDEWMSTDYFYLGCYGWICVPGDAVLENGVYYSKDGKTVFGNDGTLVGAVTIKEGVTSISNSAFSDCTGLMSVTLPSTLTSIGEDAFLNCDGLTGITIPEGVTKIGDRAFRECDNLAVISSHATTAPTISNSTFEWVESGGTLIVPQGCTEAYSQWMNTSSYYLGKYNWICIEEGNYILEDGIYYSADGTAVLGNDGTVSGSIIIKEGVTSISNSAFYYCTGLTSVTLPSTLTSIGEDAFYGCYNLATITSLATTAPTIDNYTFLYVKNGGTLIVPEGCTESYSQWMSTDFSYLGYYSWTIQEQQ